VACSIVVFEGDLWHITAITARRQLINKFYIKLIEKFQIFMKFQSVNRNTSIAPYVASKSEAH